MAIYQFYLAVIPKKGIGEYLGEIPNKLEVDFQKRAENILKNEKVFDYFEFIQHKSWEIANIDSREIIKEIDQKLDRADWGNDHESNNWKTETNEVDNDSWILIDSNRHRIKEFTFRADLRQPKLKFLIEMVKLAKEKELLLIDKNGNLVEPEIEDVIKLVKKSNAYKYVQNPNVFLEK